VLKLVQAWQTAQQLLVQIELHDEQVSHILLTRRWADALIRSRPCVTRTWAAEFLVGAATWPALVRSAATDTVVTVSP
jgi:hypothetical protein